MECENLELSKKQPLALNDTRKIAADKKFAEMRWYSCPLCKNKEFETAYAQPASLVKVSPYLVERDVIISICKKCGLVQSNPRPTPKNISKLSSHSHISAEDIGAKPTDPKGQSLKWHYEQVSFIKRICSLKPKAKVLDIGCNDGFLLAQLKKAGFDVMGVEPNPIRAIIAQNRGLLVATTLYEKALFVPKSFDLICAFHVLEHINNPYAFLSKAYSELKPNGYLCLEVPDLENPYLDSLDDFFTYHHLYYFTHTSLETMLKITGFTPIELEESNYHSFRVLAKKSNPRFELDSKEVNKAKKLIELYKAKRQRTLNKLSKEIERALEKLSGKKRVIIWGAGKHAYEILRLTPLKKHIDLLFVDPDPIKQKSGFLGYSVFSPNALTALNPELVIIGSYQVRNEIEAELKKIGIPKKKVLKLRKEGRMHNEL